MFENKKKFLSFRNVIIEEIPLEFRLPPNDWTQNRVFFNIFTNRGMRKKKMRFKGGIKQLNKRDSKQLFKFFFHNCGENVLILIISSLEAYEIKCLSQTRKGIL